MIQTKTNYANDQLPQNSAEVVYWNKEFRAERDLKRTDYTTDS